MTHIVHHRAVQAAYTPQRVPRMQGNVLIEALPPALSDQNLLGSLIAMPDFDPEQREWEAHERIQMIKSLSKFLFPLGNHLELARTLDSMMREGYVGRAPQSRQLQQKLQDIYALQKAGKRFSQAVGAIGAQDSVALIGMPGMGKTTTVKRALASYPSVIVHAEGIEQIPYIRIEMTADANSVKSLAIAIISQIDKLMPQCGYAKLHLGSTGRTNTEAMIHAAGRLVAIHHVGLIVADEVQHLSAANGVQPVMTELVKLCNMLEVPLVFIGTYKANRVLGADFRSARRSIGGLSAWGPLPRFDSGVLVPEQGEASEWQDFVTQLWEFQWVREKTELTGPMLEYLYDRTQGVIDLVIKLFAIAQVRAITSGIETLSEELFEQVYERHFGLLHEVLAAMRGKHANGRAKVLERYADLPPVDLDLAIVGYEAGARMTSKAHARALRSGQAGFATTVKTLLVEGGLDPQAADRLAQEADKAGKSEAPLQAVGRIVKDITPKLPPKPKRTEASGKVIYPDFSSRPGDYRRAAQLAAQNKTTIVEQLRATGMLRPVEDLVPII